MNYPQAIDDMDDFIHRLLEEYRTSEEIDMELHPEDHPDIIDDRKELENDIRKWLDEYSIIKRNFVEKTKK